jgi:DNA modification methylase
MDESTATIADLTPDPQNRRSHPARNRAMIAESLRSVGAARSIVIDERNEVLAGNGVVDAATAAGLSKVRIVDAAGDELIAVRRRGLTDEQKRALAMYDNRAAELAEWNATQLKIDRDNGLDLAPFFDTRELAAVFGVVPRQGRTDPDAVPDPRATSIQPGDVFECGRHVVACGNAHDPEVRARLMRGDVAAMVWGDPPYGIALDADAADRRKGFYGGTAIDERTAPWDATLDAVWVGEYAAVVRPGGYLASWGPYQGIGTIERVALACDLVWLNLFTWVKPNPPPGFPEYLAKSCEHAAIFRKPGPGRYVGPELVRDHIEMSTVTGEDRGGHPSPKPVDVVRPVVGKLTPPDGLIVDPFLGSGTMLIVAESIGRVCRGVELDPRFVQVTIDRWEAFTGSRAVKVASV